MYNCYVCEVLVLVLLFITGCRIFFLKNPRIDCFAAFVPIALVISIINFFCFGVSLFNLVIFVIAVFCFFTNFRSILRLRSHLIIDHYSTSFLISTVIELLLILVSLVFLFLNRPVRLENVKFNAEKNTVLLAENLDGSLRIKTNVIEDFIKKQSSIGKLFVYLPKIEQDDSINLEIYSDNPVLIFAGSTSGPVLNYEPYFLFLSQKGYTVLAADFYTKDTKLFDLKLDGGFLMRYSDSRFLGYFCSKMLRIFDEEKFNELKEKERKTAGVKYNSLTKLALDIFGEEKKIFYLTDGIDFDTIYTVIAENENVTAFYSLNRVDEYKTSGFGFIEQADPLIAPVFNLKRDPSLFIPRYAANKTMENIVK